MTPAISRAASPAAEPVTSPIPIVPARTGPMPVVDRQRTGAVLHAGYAREAGMLAAVTGLVLLAALLLALGVF
jgi:hypothetical protein